MIQSVPTKYNGIEFRSMLEARWAMFLDNIGAKWAYEPMTFKLDDGRMYAPDFLVYDLYIVHGRCSDSKSIDDFDKMNVFFEVKAGMSKEFMEDAMKLAKLNEEAIYASSVKKAMDMAEDGMDKNDGYPAFPLCFVGPMPSKETDELFDMDHPFYTFYYIDGDEFPLTPGVASGGKGVGLFGAEGNYIQYMDEVKTMAAFNAAKSHRFFR